MIYGFGYNLRSIQNKIDFVIKKNIPKEDYDYHIDSMQFLSHYSHMKNVYMLAKGNGRSFLDYIDTVKNAQENDKANSRMTILEGNRLLINYLTSLGMFIDYGEKEIGKALGKKAKEQFRKKTHELYDTHRTYRILVLMRDYAVHYGFPLHVHVRALSGPSGIYANRDTLLMFDRWKHAKTDIQSMPDKIALEPHVTLMQGYIDELFKLLLEIFTGRIITIFEHCISLVRLANQNSPLFFKAEDENKLRVGEFTINHVELGVVLSAIGDLERHTDITIKSKKEIKLETRLEFYYKGKLLMAGPITYFRNIMSNDINLNDTNPRLELGDRFTMDEFPEKGLSSMVRVVKLIKIYNQSNGNPDTIQYFLELYSGDIITKD